jgi:hypothetical protein
MVDGGMQLAGSSIVVFTSMVLSYQRRNGIRKLGHIIGNNGELEVGEIASLLSN